MKHVILREEELKERIIIIGDLHGCYEELKDLLKLCLFQKEKDILIFVGDLVNKGPYSVEVIRYIYQLSLENIAYIVRGNHDEAMLEIEQRDVNNRTSKYSYIQQLTREEIEWMRNLPYTITIPSYESIIVHAGLVPNIPIEEQNEKNMTKMRNLIPRNNSENKESKESDNNEGNHNEENKNSQYQEYDAVETLELGGVPWAQEWNGPMHVYFGHDAKRGLQNYPYATGLDTGCCYGRQLSAIILPGNTLIQVPARTIYSPPGKSENER